MEKNASKSEKIWFKRVFLMQKVHKKQRVSKFISLTLIDYSRRLPLFVEDAGTIPCRDVLAVAFDGEPVEGEDDGVAALLFAEIEGTGVDALSLFSLKLIQIDLEGEVFFNHSFG